MVHHIADVEVEEEEYDENADEDFNPDDAAREDGEASSSSDDEAATTTTTTTTKTSKGKKGKSVSVNNGGDLDSGDEATILERSKKRRKGGAGTGSAAVDNDDSGGDGGLIKTRAQRLAEKIEKKQRKRTTAGEITVDVDELWADLSSMPIGRTDHVLPTIDEFADTHGLGDKENMPIERGQEDGGDDEMITIKRTIEYAGESTEIEERVLRSSKEGQQYLSEHPAADGKHKGNASNLRRPLKRPSIFEPNPTASVKGVPPDRLRPRAPSRLDVIMAEKRAEEQRQKKAEKMTTVQKSALDWRGFVDQEGIRDELDEYGKSKRGYLAREEFLDRAQFARDVAAREARLKE